MLKYLFFNLIAISLSAILLVHQGESIKFMSTILLYSSVNLTILDGFLCVFCSPIESSSHLLHYGRAVNFKKLLLNNESRSNILRNLRVCVRGYIDTLYFCLPIGH